MIDFFKEGIQPKKCDPSDGILEAFHLNFEEAINVEWTEKKTKYEAIFYKENMEYIALFEKSGGLERYQVNLRRDLVPIAIIQKMEEMGEIMNAVLINEGNNIQYEIIICDSKMNRHLVFVSQSGNVVYDKWL